MVGPNAAAYFLWGVWGPGGDPGSGPGPQFTRVPRSCYPGRDRLLRIRHVDRFSGD